MMEQSAETDFVQKPAKILIVDDNEGSQNLLKRRLSVCGHEVLSAADTESSTKILAAHEIDVIFMNMFICGKSSYDFLTALKEHKIYRSIPVIMISNDSDVELVVKCIEAGAEDYLIRPLNQTLLRARLANCITKKEAHDKEVAYLAKIEHGKKQIVAQEKMASLGTLVSSISRELKNPLNFIINFAEVSGEICKELIEKTDNGKNAMSAEIYAFLSENLRKFHSNVKKITEYGNNADKIIRFMLDQSNTSAGKKHPADINKVISQTIMMLLASYKTNGITSLPRIDTDFDNTISHIPISIQSFSKAIYNILDNAMYSIIVKFGNTPAGKIKIKTENDAHCIKISIHDNGVGISSEIKEKIFIPFFTTKPEGTGPGLGLSTAMEVIQNHGGTVTVNSEENEFAEFNITIEKS
ncbi:MAG: hybrid sensor histidine kinase/response regulator [Holosporaceae bacterium]|nr:hybrid sensor histidine kinase/response regulator [Holosporaceae bacterium]